MTTSDYTSKTNKRFLNKVNKNGSIPAHMPHLGKCWEWTASIRKDGYGQFTLNSKNCLAHRASWIIYNGVIPNKLFVLHKCDNPKCVNPAHLFLGTNQDNVDDRERKGRNNAPRGEKHRDNILTELQVMDIRKKYSEGGITYRELAEQYCMAESTIGNIIKYRKWSWLK